MDSLQVVKTVEGTHVVQLVDNNTVIGEVHFLTTFTDTLSQELAQEYAKFKLGTLVSKVEEVLVVEETKAQELLKSLADNLVKKETEKAKTRTPKAKPVVEVKDGIPVRVDKPEAPLPEDYTDVLPPPITPEAEPTVVPDPTEHNKLSDIEDEI